MPNYQDLLYEGKAKKIFSSESSDQVFIEFKDDATAFNAQKKSIFDGKGIINCQISSDIYRYLENKGLSTHFINQVDKNIILAKSVKILPIEIVMRNKAYGSLCKQTPILPGKKLSPPLLEFYFKDDDLGDPLLTVERLRLLNIVSETRLTEISNMARKINSLLIDYFNELDLELVDFKIEVGTDNYQNLILADEISPDTCRLWDKRIDDESRKILDKDRFRKDLGGVLDGYGEILKRIQYRRNKSADPCNLSMEQDFKKL